ncbi:MAG: hypothetical protein IPI95_15900 [Flavobacteriales bacterium]|nr:hypothetical protein [Flavobacteriales bacterium]
MSRTIPVAPAQVRALNRISVIYAGRRSRSAKDSSMFYSQQAIALARRIGDEEGLAEALYDLGKYYVGVAGSPAKATENLLESLELYTQLNDRSGISMPHAAGPGQLHTETLRGRGEEPGPLAQGGG